MDVDQLQQALGGRYTIIRELGHGGMATVYLAEDKKLGRRVAIKVLRPDLASAVGPERFLREIKIAARLQHPGILDLYDSGSYDGILYYVMPYVEGESLRARLDRAGQLPVDEALRIVGEVADALSYAHGCGVVHRDIKPENILISGGHAVVADFGIARAISEAGDERLTASDQAVGTPAYMSPEQAQGKKDLDGRTDVYTLACVLFEMLAGEQVFEADNVRALIAAHMFEEPRSLDTLCPTLPDAVVSAVEMALAKAPDARFSTASEFKTALEIPVDETVRPRPGPWARAHWSVKLGVSAAAAVVGVLVVLWLWPHAVELDPNKVVVFPPVDRSGDSPSVEAGLGVAYAIEAALDHTDPLRWDHGWDRLSEPVRRDPLLLTGDSARRISLGRGAGHYIDGVIVPEDGSLSVQLRLHDVRGDSVVAVERATAARGGIPVALLGLRAVVGLLPKLVDPGRKIELSALTDREPAAIALWVQGEREYRNFRFGNALELYHRALEEDSLLVFAAIKGAQAAGWKAHFDEAEALIAHAVAHDSLLPGRYRHLAHGFDAFVTGRADSAVTNLQAALAEDPEWSEPAAALGETYYHLFPSGEGLDSLAERMFERALAHDSTFMSPLLHLGEIASRKGDYRRAQRFVDRLELIEADTGHYRHLHLMLECVRLGAEQMDWEDAARSDPVAVWRTAAQLAVAGSNMACAERGFRAVLSEPGASPSADWGSVLGLQGLLVAQGRDREAVALLDSVVEAGVSGALSLYVIDAMAGANMEVEAQEVEGLARENFGRYYERSGSSLHWLMGAWAVRGGYVEKVERISAALDSLAQDSGSRRHRLLADAVACHRSLARGDTAGAIARLRALSSTARRDVLLGDFVEALAVERALLADLLLARGEFEEAHQVAGIFDHPGPLMFLPFLGRSLEVRLRAAEELGWEDRAAEYGARLQALGRGS
jgi:tRNA A-37 threonylcarbamoyl transferase component Bud32/tetratricopeptide (TPR) repeat protein